MITDKKIANAVSGKTARACDCCVRKRARWYCPADDAYLCQSCDASVHSANSLARRHDRFRLKTSSLKPSDELDSPFWHRGLTRKPRTPRGHPKNQSKSEDRNLMNVIVPELSMEDTNSPQEFETEEQLLYRVPICDPFVTDFPVSNTEYGYEEETRSFEVERGSDVGNMIFDDMKSSNHDEYMPSDLEEFAADVESLLGKGLDCESFGIDELGILDCSLEIGNDINNINNINNNNIDCSDRFVKEEVEFLGCEGDLNNNGMIVIKDPFQLSFDYDENDDHKEIVMVEQSSVVNEMGKFKRKDEEENKEMVFKRRKKLLSLDYEAISEAWASHGSPWINGQRPEINPEDCWPLCMGACGPEVRHPLFGEIQMGGNGDGGREARVSRYREKRRTRLFSKKIRYEVRKLNAEKRPRMKGRFVKRSSFVDAATTFPLFPKN